MIRTIGFVFLCIVAFADISDAIALDINNAIQTYSSLNNTTVTMTGHSELHLTSAVSPLTGCQINLNASDAWLFLTNIKPSVVNTSAYLSQIRVNGATAVLNTNVRVVQYVLGTVVIPHSTSFQPLEVFNGGNFSGTSMKMGLYTYYKTSQLGTMNDAIHSFHLKRGYMATFAQNADGTGISKVYIAKDEDLNIGLMPGELDNSVSFVRVFPWRWVNKKGWAGGAADATALSCSWRYDWDNADASTLDMEYVPMRHNAYWNSYSNINNKQNSTHVLAFNEPDKTDQADMTVEQVLAAWPNLLASGLRLGSPAPSDGGLSWLYDFIDQADALNYRVDYVAVHFYKGGWTASQLYNWLLGIHQRTGRPLWVTEWNNGANWTCCEPTLQSNATAIGNFINSMNNAPFVERYSVYNWVGSTRELITSGVLNPAGVVYRDNVTPVANVLDVNHECIGHWRLDEVNGTTVTDISGKENHAVTKNGLSFDNNSVPGMLGYALRFDGTDDHIQLPAGFDEFDNGFSAAFWTYPTAVKKWARFIDLGNGPNANNIIVSRFDTTNDLTVQGFSGSSGGSYVRASNAITLNTWQFFAVAMDNLGNTKIYKNGQLIQTGTTTRPLSVQRNLNYIGRSNWSADAYFQGDMDDIRIFDYPLSENEISTIYLSNVSRPYNGNPISIPGRIEAEQFDLGNQGIASYDTTGSNTGGQFRFDTDTDIRTISDYGTEYAVTQIMPGEWLQYTINITESADYCVYLRASATADNIPVTIKLNDTTIGTFLINSTGSFNTFQTWVLTNLVLTTNENQALRLEFPAGGLEVNWIQFEKQGPWGGLVRALPGKLQAEEFDFGGQGIGYYDTTLGNSGGSFRPYEQVDIAAITDGSADYAIENIEDGEWLAYTVNSNATQTDLHARIASTQAGGQIRVLLDDDVLATVTIPNTGSLDTWQTVSIAGLILPEKEKALLKLEFLGTGFRLNQINFQTRMPYLGTPSPIPGRIQFEDFDLGGQYVGYYDSTPLSNTYSYYRPNEGVEIMTVSDNSGFAVYAAVNEWLEYTCNVQRPGFYTIIVRHTSSVADQELTMSLDQQTLATVVLPKTGSWSAWQNTAVTDIFLPEGEQILRFTMIKSTALINYVDFFNYADFNLSTQVDAEDFAILSAQWKTTPGTPSADIAPLGGDNIVDEQDLQALIENWLMGE